MASSSKRRGTSTIKQSDADKTRVISVGRKETLPRQSTAVTGRRKPLAQPAVDAPTETMTTVALGSKKKAPRRQPKETAAAGPKAVRGAVRRSGNRKVAAVVQEETQAQTQTLAPAEMELETEVEASAIVEETVVETPIALPEQTALPALATASADSTPIAAPAPHHGKRSLVTAVFRLFSALSRWAGGRQ